MKPTKVKLDAHHGFWIFSQAGSSLGYGTAPGQRLQRFIKWFSSHAGTDSDSVSPAVAIQSIPNMGLGLVATRPVGPCETMLEVPKALIMNRSRISEHDDHTRPSFLNLDAIEDDLVLLSLFLLREKMCGPASFWAPYLAILPTTTLSSALWPQDVLDLMLGSDALTTILARQQRLRSDYDSVLDVLRSLRASELTGAGPGTSPVSFLEYAHAYATVGSRFWRPDELGGQATIVPYADMANHSEETETYVHFSEATAQLVSGHPYSAGDQVFVSYGARPNRVLALDYGFILPYNPFDTVSFTLSISSQSLASAPVEREALLLAAGFSEPVLEVDLVRGQPISQEALRFARLGSIQTEREAQQPSAAFGAKVSDLNEARALGMIRDAIEERLRKYPPDVVAFARQGMTDRVSLPERQMAAALVHGEIQILEDKLLSVYTALKKLQAHRQSSPVQIL